MIFERNWVVFGGGTVRSQLNRRFVRFVVVVIASNASTNVSSLSTLYQTFHAALTLPDIKK